MSVNLPHECWELIFCLIDHHRHFESLSLVSNHFLALTNQLRVSLTVSDPTLLYLPRLLRRFQHLKSVGLRDFHGDLESVLFQIAKSGLSLESLDLSNQEKLPVNGLREFGSNMKSLKSLKCSKISFLQDTHLFVIASSFPFLEELDISYPEHRLSEVVTDLGVLSLASSLKNLIRIDLSGNHFIADESLIALSLKCVLLREIAVRDCDFITQNAIAFAIRNSPKLNSISVNEIGFPSIDVGFKESFVYSRALSAIELSNSCVSDELLYSIVEACLPLEKLILSHCYNFTSAGISLLLCKYQSLTLLSLEGVNFLTDENISELSMFLSKLASINLSFCSKLTNSTFFALIKNCPLLNEIKMERTNLGEENIKTDVVVKVNPRVKSLNLARNGNLGNESIKKFVSVCPNLEHLNLSSCGSITGEGIVEIFNRCCEIRHFEIKHLKGIKDLVIDFEVSKMEVLYANGTAINDDALAMIGRRFCRLLHLDLTGCLNVTGRGVKEVVEKCRGLREINLKWCDNVNVDIVPWMVFSRPSLRKIIPPCGSVPIECQRSLFLRHGCLVCEG